MEIDCGVGDQQNLAAGLDSLLQQQRSQLRQVAGANHDRIGLLPQLHGNRATGGGARGHQRGGSGLPARLGGA